jgi:hypothetical protein
VVTVVVARGNLNSGKGNAKSFRCVAVRRKGNVESREMVMSAVSRFPGIEALEMVCILAEARTTLLFVPSQLSRHHRHRLQPVGRSYSDPGTSVVG